jgi:ATP-dependent Clp protease adaptor protein ClpS
MEANAASVLFYTGMPSMTDPEFNQKVCGLPTLSRTLAVAPVSGPEANNNDGGSDDGKTGTGTVTKTRTKTKRPSLYRVLLLNDDYTPMEFVVLILQDVFNKSREDAMQIMLHVHQQGVGECGVYPYEVAETKVTRVMDSARKNQHPLQCVMEKQ